MQDVQITMCFAVVREHPFHLVCLLCVHFYTKAHAVNVSSLTGSPEWVKENEKKGLRGVL